MITYTQFKNAVHTVLITGAISLTLNGCGKQTFDVLQSEHQTDAPGGIDIPARVDILFVIDNTGSMNGKEAFVGAQLKSQFIAKLDAQNWDYRLAIIPTTPTAAIPLTQMAVSKYSLGHPNYTVPYPNASVTTDPELQPDWSVARTADAFYANAPYSGSSGAEPTMITIGDVLNTTDWKTRFLRNSAKLVVIVLSNGDDTSEPARTDIYPYVTPTTVNASLVARIKSVRPNARFHSIVNVHAGSGVSCLNGTFRPNRYLYMTSIMNGRSYALCTPTGLFDTSFTTLLPTLAADLQPIRQEYEQEYVVIDHPPIVNTISVRKNSGGSSVLLSPTSADGLCSSGMNGNGWCYDGQGSTYEITTPVFLNYKTGYKIRLVGTARAIGSETLEVHYQEFGTGISH